MKVELTSQNNFQTSLGISSQTTKLFAIRRRMNRKQSDTPFCHFVVKNILQKKSHIWQTLFPDFKQCPASFVLIKTWNSHYEKIQKDEQFHENTKLGLSFEFLKPILYFYFSINYICWWHNWDSNPHWITKQTHTANILTKLICFIKNITECAFFLNLKYYLFKTLLCSNLCTIGLL